MYNAAYNIAQYSTPRNNVGTIDIVRIRIFHAKNLLTNRAAKVTS